MPRKSCSGKATSATPKSRARKRHLKRKLAKGQPSPYSKLTDEIEGKICGYIAGGMKWEDACELCGIHRTTAWHWRDRGAAGEPRYAQFMVAANTAEVKSKALLVAEIRRDTDWRAKQWLLINRFPDEFKIRYYQELAGRDGGAIQTNSTVNPFKVEVILAGVEPTEFTTIDHSGNGHGERQ